jgi:uncharacterized protein YciI
MQPTGKGLIVVVALIATALPVNLRGLSEGNYSQANPHTLHAYVMLIRLRGDLYSRWKTTGKWPEDKTANSALDEHSKYWDEQLHQGRAILAGGMDGDFWDNVALIIFEAASPAEAQDIVAADPAVKAYVFQAQVRPFNVSFITNKFDAGSARASSDSH